MQTIKDNAPLFVLALAIASLYAMTIAIAFSMRGLHI